MVSRFQALSLQLGETTLLVDEHDQQSNQQQHAQQNAGDLQRLSAFARVGEGSVQNAARDDHHGVGHVHLAKSVQGLQQKAVDRHFFGLTTQCHLL